MSLLSSGPLSSTMTAGITDYGQRTCADVPSSHAPLQFLLTCFSSKNYVQLQTPFIAPVTTAIAKG